MFLGPNLPEMNGLILFLMLNLCYMAVILNFLVVTWCTAHYLVVVTASYCNACYVVVNGIYCLLLLITLLVPTFSMNAVVSMDV